MSAYEGVGTFFTLKCQPRWNIENIIRFSNQATSTRVYLVGDVHARELQGDGAATAARAPHFAHAAAAEQLDERVRTEGRAGLRDEPVGDASELLDEAGTDRRDDGGQDRREARPRCVIGDVDR